VRAGAVVSLFRIVTKPLVLLSLTLTAVTMMSAFIVIPNIPAFAQFNLGFPPERLDVLYLLGGIASFATTRMMGPLVDRHGAPAVSIAGSILLAFIVWLWFVAIDARIPVLIVSTSFFIAMGTRGVAYNTLTSTVPEPHERARFQSVQSAVQHGASAAAAFISAQLLIELPDHSLGQVERVGIVSLVLVAVVPVLMVILQRAVARKARAGSPGVDAPAP
jgi:predicted MFS family arabinose efflux permease